MSKARRLFCQLAVGKMDYPGAEMATMILETDFVKAIYSDIKARFHQIGAKNAEY